MDVDTERNIKAETTYACPAEPSDDDNGVDVCTNSEATKSASESDVEFCAINGTSLASRLF